MHGNDGIKPVRDFWKNGAHSGALFSTSPLPSLSPFSFLFFFFLSLPSRWQPVTVAGSRPASWRQTLQRKDELQVCQTCKHALITHFPADDNEVTEIIAVFFFFSFSTPRRSLSENDRMLLRCCLLSLNEQFIQNNVGKLTKGDCERTTCFTWCVFQSPDRCRRFWSQAAALLLTFLCSSLNSCHLQTEA